MAPTARYVRYSALRLLSRADYRALMKDNELRDVVCQVEQAEAYTFVKEGAAFILGGKAGGIDPLDPRTLTPQARKAHSREGEDEWLGPRWQR